MRNIILKQEFKEYEKLIYVKILEDFFEKEDTEKYIKKNFNLTEDEFLFELTIKFFDFAKKNFEFDLESDKNDLSCSFKTHSKIFKLYSQSIDSFSNFSEIFSVNNITEKINVEKFDSIKTNVKFLTQNSILKLNDKKVITLDKLLDDFYKNF